MSYYNMKGLHFPDITFEMSVLVSFNCGIL